ncbi:MAG: hypothetical protein O3B24_07560 [Verrucomicrobia bacterium]|nr:hypothetical protein [Verrucomicrobiota bacterium]
MAERDTRGGGQERGGLDEMVLTRVGDDAVIRPLDGVTMDEVKRYMQAERSRNRRVVVWTGTLLLGVFLFFLVIFLSIGIYVIHTREATGEALGTLRERGAAQVATLGTVSNRVAQMEALQQELDQTLKQVSASEITRNRELDGVLASLEKIRAWVDDLDAQRKADMEQIDGQLRDARDDAAQKIAAVKAEVEDLIHTVEAPRASGIPPAMPDMSKALRDLPDFGGLGETEERMPTSHAMLEAVELTERGIEAAGVFAVQDVEAYDPGSARREIVVVDFPSGDHYEGEMENGVMHGWGIYTHRSGDRYDGQFREGLRHGHGTLVYANGDKYTGDFQADLRSGTGSLFTQNGDRYAGQFANDVIAGRGTMLYASGIKYTGGFVNGLRQGVGILRFANGDLYRGAFAQDGRTGLGTYVFADGSQYAGEFADGRREGRGRYVYASGEAYEGEFMDGARHGEGVSIFPNGKRIKGLWESDKLVRYLAE